MPVAGFFSPTASMIKEETYRALKEAGITQIIESNMSYTDRSNDRYLIYQELAYAQKYGISVLVRDERLHAKGVAGETVTVEMVKEAVKYYENYQSFAGLFMVDEPKSMNYITGSGDERYIQNYASMAKAIHDAGIPGWTNAFGGAGFFSNRSQTYEYYMYFHELVDTMQPSVVSFTSYPFWDEYEDAYINSHHKYCVENTADTYFMNLAMAKDVADKQGLSFRTFIQAGEGFELEPNGNYKKGQFLWNANVGLAFGSKGLQYFPLVHPDSLQNYADGSCASGLLDSKGNPVKSGLHPYYTWAQEVAKQVDAVEDILMQANNKGYMATGGYAKTKGTDVIKKITCNKGLNIATIKMNVVDSYAGATVTSSDETYGAFVGCFEMDADSKYAGKQAMYIVNFNADTENTNRVTASFDSAKEVTVIHNGVTKTLTASQVSCALGAGEAVLLLY